MTIMQFEFIEKGTHYITFNNSVISYFKKRSDNIKKFFSNDESFEKLFLKKCFSKKVDAVELEQIVLDLFVRLTVSIIYELYEKEFKLNVFSFDFIYEKVKTYLQEKITDLNNVKYVLCNFQLIQNWFCKLWNVLENEQTCYEFLKE